jgi:hypothetical protein
MVNCVAGSGPVGVPLIAQVVVLIVNPAVANAAAFAEPALIAQLVIGELVLVAVDNTVRGEPTVPFVVVLGKLTMGPVGVGAGAGTGVGAGAGLCGEVGVLLPPPQADSANNAIAPNVIADTRAFDFMTVSVLLRTGDCQAAERDVGVPRVTQDIALV